MLEPLFNVYLSITKGDYGGNDQKQLGGENQALRNVDLFKYYCVM